MAPPIRLVISERLTRLRMGCRIPVRTTISGKHAETTKATITRSETTLRDLEAEYERPLRQREAARVSTSFKLPVKNKLRAPLVTPLIDEGVSVEEALTIIVNGRVEQQEHISKRMIELERAVHVEREGFPEEILCNKQEVSHSEKCLKKKMDNHLARSLS